MAVVVPTGSPVKNNSVQSQPGGLPRLPTHASMGRQGDPSEAKSTFAAARRMDHLQSLAPSSSGSAPSRRSTSARPSRKARNSSASQPRNACDRASNRIALLTAASPLDAVAVAILSPYRSQRVRSSGVRRSRCINQRNGGTCRPSALEC